MKNFTQKDLETFILWSRWLCSLITLIPVYFLVSQRIYVGDNRKVHPWKILTPQTDPQEYWLVLAGVCVLIGLVWLGRSYLVKHLRNIVDA